MSPSNKEFLNSITSHFNKHISKSEGGGCTENWIFTIQLQATQCQFKTNEMNIVVKSSTFHHPILFSLMSSVLYSIRYSWLSKAYGGRRSQVESWWGRRASRTGLSFILLTTTWRYIFATLYMSVYPRRAFKLTTIVD